MLNEDAQLRRNYANRSFQRARECFNAQRMTDCYIQFYRSIAARKVSAA